MLPEFSSPTLMYGIETLLSYWRLSESDAQQPVSKRLSICFRLIPSTASSGVVVRTMQGYSGRKHHEIEWFFPTTVDSWGDTTIEVDATICAETLQCREARFVRCRSRLALAW